MPLNDSQMVGLLQLLLAQQKEILQMKAHLIVLEHIAVELAGDDVKQRLFQDTQALLESTSFDSSRELIQQLEQAIYQLLPASGVKN
jgi:hypothetical protein